jgi:hypothetical protein
MGIHGLPTFMKENKDLLLKTHKLQQTDLVIDGQNILHYVFEIEKLDFLHGGDYNRFADVIRNFFNDLKRCGVRPIVVMDGGHSMDDRKLKTRISRAEKRFDRLNSQYQRLKTEDFSDEGQQTLPILGYSLYLNVLRDMDIEIIACQFEADREMARIANQKRCPVLSQDSDFFALPIEEGFIPIDYLEIIDKEEKSMMSKIYHVSNFTSFFPRIGSKVFPLLAALFGNDYTNYWDFKPFLDSILNSPRVGTDHPDLKTTDRRKKEMINWLQSIPSSSSAKDQMSEAEKQKFQIIVEAYSLKLPSPFLYLVPKWFIKDHRECRIASIFMTIVTSQRIFLPCQSEDFESKTYYECSKPLRQILYGILLRDRRKTTVEEYDRHGHVSSKPFSKHKGEDTTCKVSMNKRLNDHTKQSHNIQGNGKQNHIQPCTRCNHRHDSERECPAIGQRCRYCKKMNHFEVCCRTKEKSEREVRYKKQGASGYNETFVLKSIVPVHREMKQRPLPGLSEIPSMTVVNRQKLLECALEMGNIFDDFDPEMKILLGMTSFWYKHASPSVSSNHLSSLIVCWIMLKIQNPKPSRKENTIDKTVDESPQAILKEILTNLVPYCSPPASKIRFDIVHAFAQFQTCLISAHDLNSILGNPFPNFYIHETLFFGTFLHEFCITLENKSDGNQFVMELLVAGSKLSKLYKDIVQKF